jgi:hypothetical protein
LIRRPPGAGPAGAAALCGLLLAVLPGCRGSDPQPLELISLDPFGDQASLVAGGGASSIVGHTGTSGGSPILRLERHDRTSPDRLTLLGDVRFAGGGAITRLVVTDEAAAVNVGGVVKVVDLTVPALPIETLDVLGDASALAVGGSRVLAVAGGDLVLVDRGAPVVTAQFTPAAEPTCLVAAGGVFLAFTADGYVLVDPSSATTFAEVTDPTLAGVRDASADGASALVAGPASSPGRSRILRLDLSNPAAPAVVRGHEVPGAYVAFAWDGGSTAVIAVHGSGDGADPRAFHEGWVVREGAGGFADEGVPLTFWSETSQPLAAHVDRLFAVEAQGLLFLRIR